MSSSAFLLDAIPSSESIFWIRFSMEINDTIKGSRYT
jgi:hypothetical protein